MPNWKKLAVSGSAASFASLYIDTSITASIISGSEFTGSLYGTASQAISSSYALTASYVLGPPTVITGSNATFIQSTPATTWVFNHYLNSQFPVLQVFNASNQVIIPASITANDTTTATITFSVPTAGTAVASIGGYTGSQTVPSASFATTASFAITASYAASVGMNFEQVTPSNTWTINHNLNNRYPLVQAYGSDSLVLIPQTISGSSVNTVVITFSTAISGYARVI